MKRFSISTLGCKVNSFESELIAKQLVQQNFQRVEPYTQADVCVINTCTVTAEADRQARQLIRRIIRTNPTARVVVTGCYAQSDARACESIPGVDWVVGNDRKLDIPALLATAHTHELPKVISGKIASSQPPTTLIDGFAGRARAYLQIQQGCDQGCTFCIIHKVRGPNRSFSAGGLQRQAKQFVNNGYREIVLCGVDIGSYGADFGITDETTTTLSKLVRQLCTVDGDFRIRLSSIDPMHITDELIELIANQPKICPQLHLSMQSGNTIILKRMKRRATREILYECVRKLRQAVPELVLSADIMVGFPTETEEHFAETLQAVDELEIAYPHVFPYSPRSNTPAAKIPMQVAVHDRKYRAKLVREAGKQIWHKVAQRRVGTRVKVLVEESHKLPDGWLRARAADYFPVHFDARHSNRPIEPGDWAKVEITAVETDALAGSWVE